MDKIKVIEPKESVFASNDAEADRVRQKLKEDKTYLLNIMSSPVQAKLRYSAGLLKTFRRMFG